MVKICNGNIRVVKSLRVKQPKVLAELLDKTLFEEPRKPGMGKFYDGSRPNGESNRCKTGLS